jgi:hypothetical protein
MKKIFVDIDETICITPEPDENGQRDYSKSKVIQENLDKINKLFEEGNHITYWTARGSVNGKDWWDLTHKQLLGWGAQFHELLCTKPFFDILIDDRTIRIEEL